MKVFSKKEFDCLKIIAVLSLPTVFFGYFMDIASAGTLACAVSATCPDGVVLFKISSTANAHSELSSQSNYNQLVCCDGVMGLGNSCSGNYTVIAKLSGATNAHIEQNNQTNYSNNSCISVPSSGTVSVGYGNDCATAGYDTTIASMSNITNAHAGNATAYSTKICATGAGAGTLTVDIVDVGGNPVSNPSVAMSEASFSFAYQTVNGALGTSSERIRVENTTDNPMWTLDIAPTLGPTSFWDGISKDYDFNDPTPSVGDGSDADNLGGQMSIDPLEAVITPKSGCSTSGLTLGSPSSYSEGVVDSITLLSAGASAGTNCYYDIVGVDVSQTIPAEQLVGNYLINMTLTITAI